MTLIGMSKETYLKILDEVDEIYYLINLDGRFTNTLEVENVLMKRHGIDIDDARSFIHLVYRNDVAYKLIKTGPVWTADRPEPKLENYPEVAEFLKEN